MKTITIDDLHQETEQWVRWAAEHGQVVVTDNGAAIAAIQPVPPATTDNPFAHRRLVPTYAAVMNWLSGGTDSTDIVSEDRDRAAP